MSIVKGNPNCELCGLCRTAEYVCFTGEGGIPSNLMMIGGAPGFREDETGEPFQGGAGRLLDEILEQCGSSRKEFYLTYAVKCRTPEDKAPSAKEIKTCRVYLDQEIKKIKPKFVLLLGATALKAVLGKAKITELHGTIFEKEGIVYLPTFALSAALRDPKRLEPLRHDIRKFIKLSKGITTEKHYETTPKIVKSVVSLRKCLEDLLKNRMISFDLECTGLNRFEEGGDITMLILGTRKYQWLIPMNILGTGFRTHSIRKSVLGIVGQVLDHRVTKCGGELSGQNAKFDNLWLMHKYGIRYPLTFDVMLASHLCNENSLMGLKYLTKTLLNGPDYDLGSLDEKQGKWGLTPNFLKYGAFDGLFTRKLHKLFKKELPEQDLDFLFKKLVMPVARAYEIVENNGVYVDVEKMAKVEKDVVRRMNEAKAELDDFIPKHWGLGEVNWNSSDQVGVILFKKMKLKPVGYTPKGKPSTAEDFLNRMRGKHEIIDPLLRYRGAQKMHSSFIEGWKKRMYKGRWLFPSYKVAGTVTGRPSCVNPNFQQVPRDPIIRSLIGAPEGWVVFEADYSQVELRIAAVLSGDREMIRIFQTGGDIHRATASAAMGIPEEEVTKEDRKKAKAINFGFLYGMGWRKFKEYALDKYGVVLTDLESKQFRTRFFEKYPGLVNWHIRMRKVVKALGQVRTMTGRIRHLPEIDSPDQGMRAQAERNAINSPVQGFGAELTLMSLVEIVKNYSTKDLQVFGTVHDATLGRVRIRKARRILTEIKEIMEYPPLFKEFGIDLPIPIVVDITVGNWGNGVDLSQWRQAA